MASSWCGGAAFFNNVVAIITEDSRDVTNSKGGELGVQLGEDGQISEVLTRASSVASKSSAASAGSPPHDHVNIESATILAPYECHPSPWDAVEGVSLSGLIGKDVTSTFPPAPSTKRGLPHPDSKCLAKSHDSEDTPDTSSSSGNSDSSLNYSSNKKKKMTLPQRYALSIARNPVKHFWVAIVISISMSLFVAFFGELTIKVGNEGWLTRGTKIADRSTQQIVLSNVMHETSKENSKDGSRNLRKDTDFYCSGEWYGSSSMVDPNEVNLNSIWKTTDADYDSPAISAIDAEALHELCMVEQNTLKLLEEQDLCYKCPIDDESSQKKCLQPYSLVSIARIYLNFLNGVLKPDFLVPSMSCDELRNRWTDTIQKQFSSLLTDCSNYMLEQAGLKQLQDGQYSNCHDLPILTATLVDNQFIQSNLVKYTSSIYATKSDAESVEAMYRAGLSAIELDLLTGYYEVGVNSLYTTGKQGFYELYLNDILPKELAISVGATVVTTCCILLHTKSVFLTTIGLIQIVLALPVAYFVYYFICGLTLKIHTLSAFSSHQALARCALPSFPFVNINAVFIVFALGADDLFVVVDKWHMKRHQHPLCSTTDLAVACLPDAAYATFVTSITSAIAFLASAVVNVPAVALFAIFCGLVIAMDYILCIVLVFPAMCLYDKWVFVNGCSSRWLTFCRSEKQVSGIFNTNPSDSKLTREVANERKQLMSFERILSYHYSVVHNFRWPLLFISIAAIVACSFVTVQLRPPDDPDQPFLPSSNSYEIHRVWSRNLLSGRGGGAPWVRVCSVISLMWGLVPADTGFHLNPENESELMLDSLFEPRHEATQSYLLDFCHHHIANFRKPDDGYTCVMTIFDWWLGNETLAQLRDDGTVSEEWYINCQGADSIPVPSDIFDSCMISFENFMKTGHVLHDESSVKVISMSISSNTTMFSPFEEQEKEYSIVEEWYSKKRLDAPAGANGFFWASYDFWIYDTFNDSRLSAYRSGVIALACASAMILLTSKSVTIMLFSAISIGYVLVASTACLVGLGWRLGLFESILFGVLIGIGCDFVLHLGHAYITPPGTTSKELRTCGALQHIGPSVLGSAFTTLSTGVFMLLAENLAIYKFGLMLIMTITHSLIGSFVVFLSLCDCLGPKERPILSVPAFLKSKK